MIGLSRPRVLEHSRIKYFLFLVFTCILRHILGIYGIISMYIHAVGKIFKLPFAAHSWI